MNHKSGAIGVLSAAFFIFGGLAQGEPLNDKITWKKKASMPGPLYTHTPAIMGDNIHVIAGRGKSSELVNCHYVCDILKDVWIEKPPLPVDISNLAAVIQKMAPLRGLCDSALEKNPCDHFKNEG